VIILISTWLTASQEGLTGYHFLFDGLYQGELREGAPHGSGTINYDFIPDGKYNYSGSWKDGKRQGLGITWFRNDDIHQGYYENDKPHGNGQKKYSDGLVYEGNFENGLRNGTGSLHYTDGTKRQGEWVHDQLEGFVAYYPNGSDTYNKEFWKNGFKVSDEILDTFTPSSIITENSFDKTSFIGPDDLRKIWTSKTKFSSQALKK